MKTNERVLITGAGSGIGKALTRLFLADGAQVLAVSLLPEELSRLQSELDPAGQRLTTLAMDLSTADAAPQLLAHCQSAGLTVDVLVNNAGFACYGDAVDENLAKLSAMIALNVTTTAMLSVLFGQQMKARGQGSILNVGSTAGMLPTTRFAAYGASKSFVNTFSYALRAELAPFGVKVCCLTPAAVATNFAKTANIDGYKGASKLKDHFSNKKASTPQDIAQAAFAGLRANKAQILCGNGAGLAGWLYRLVPQSKLPVLLKGM